MRERAKAPDFSLSLVQEEQGRQEGYTKFVQDVCVDAMVSVSYTHLDVYKRQICNMALARIGHDAIELIDEPSEDARLCRRFYDQAVRPVSSTHLPIVHLLGFLFHCRLHG